MLYWNTEYITGGWVLDREPPDRVLNPDTLGIARDSDFRELCGNERIRDRGTAACAAHAVANAAGLRRGILAGEPRKKLSSLALYYWTRLEERPIPEWGSGIRIEQATTTARSLGIPEEKTWPWDSKHLNCRPCFLAETGETFSFQKILSESSERVDHVIRCLAEGRPVVFGTQVGPQWNKYQSRMSGTQLKPLRPEKSKLGHVTVLVGYVDGLFIGEASYGSSWGVDGFYFASPDLISSDTSGNFWVID